MVFALDVEMIALIRIGTGSDARTKSGRPFKISHVFQDLLMKDVQ